MRLGVKALLISLAIHTLLLLLIINFSRDSFHAHKIFVIDLTLMEPVTAGAESCENKESAIYETQTTHQKASPEDVIPVKELKTEEAKEEITKTEVKITQVYENIHVDEKVPEVKTVSFVQNIEQGSVSGVQGMCELTDTFLSIATGNTGKILEEGGTATNRQQNSRGGTGSKGVLGRYLKSHLSYIKDIIQKNITYPDIARRKGWMGKVIVSFSIPYNGYAKEIKVIQSSGFKILDKSAEEAVRRSSPFPYPPAEARIILPILYELH